MEIIKSEKQKEKGLKKSEQNLRDSWYTIKQTNICIKGVPEGEERENGAEGIFEEIIAENISNLMEIMNINTKEAQKNAK